MAELLNMSSLEQVIADALETWVCSKPSPLESGALPQILAAALRSAGVLTRDDLEQVGHIDAAGWVHEPQDCVVPMSPCVGVFRVRERDAT